MHKTFDFRCQQLILLLLSWLLIELHSSSSSSSSNAGRQQHFWGPIFRSTAKWKRKCRRVQT